MHTPDSRIRAPARGTAVAPATSSAARALAVASALFSTTTDTSDLLRTVARMLCAEPGHMCLVSLVQQDILQPIAIDHAGARAAAHLRTLVVPGRATPADAFSLEAQRRGNAYRMSIPDPRLMQLWLPSAYWWYASQVHVSSILAAALNAHGRTIGTLLLWREGATPAYDDEDRAYVAALASRLAVALAL